MIKVTSSGSFHNLENWAQRVKSKSYLTQLEHYGALGVAALKAATPVDSDATALAWTYKIVNRKGYFSIQWFNMHTEDPGHIPVAILIQYGHGTRNGGYVSGKDFINPALRPIFDQIATDMWREVTR